MPLGKNMDRRNPMNNFEAFKSKFTEDDFLNLVTEDFACYCCPAYSFCEKIHDAVFNGGMCQGNDNCITIFRLWAKQGAKDVD